MTEQVPPFVGSPRQIAQRVRLAAAHSWAGHHYRHHDGWLSACPDLSCRRACAVFDALDASPPYLACPPCTDGSRVHDFKGETVCPSCGFAGIVWPPHMLDEGDAA